MTIRNTVVRNAVVVMVTLAILVGAVSGISANTPNIQRVDLTTPQGVFITWFLATLIGDYDLFKKHTTTYGALGEVYAWLRPDHIKELAQEVADPSLPPPQVFAASLWYYVDDWLIIYLADNVVQIDLVAGDVKLGMSSILVRENGLWKVSAVRYGGRLLFDDVLIGMKGKF